MTRLIPRVDSAPPELMARLTDLIPTHETTVWSDAGHIAIAKHIDGVLEHVLDR